VKVLLIGSRLFGSGIGVVVYFDVHCYGDRVLNNLVGLSLLEGILLGLFALLVRILVMFKHLWRCLLQAR
jgi:hypothetical protein